MLSRRKLSGVATLAFFVCSLILPKINQMCATLMLFVVDQPSAMLTMPEEEYNPEKYSIIPLIVPHAVFTHMKNN